MNAVIAIVITGPMAIYLFATCALSFWFALVCFGGKDSPKRITQ